MSDPFAVRMTFKRSYLEKLTSSPASQLRAAAYALKYREQDEDLHSCILEQLDASNINLRANIMFFIEHLCDLAKREGHMEYVENVRRDLERIVGLVAPGTRAGGMNIRVVRKVLLSFQDKKILSQQQVTRLLSHLSARESLALSEIANPADAMVLDRSDGIHDLDEKDIEQRMEEDRERHKRLREDTWAVDPETELDGLYESGKQGLTEKLLQDCRDDAKARKLAVELDELSYKGVEKGDTPLL